MANSLDENVRLLEEAFREYEAKRRVLIAELESLQANKLGTEDPEVLKAGLRKVDKADEARKEALSQIYALLDVAMPQFSDVAQRLFRLQATALTMAQDDPRKSLDPGRN